jgi:hypothetical protein
VTGEFVEAFYIDDHAFWRYSRESLPRPPIVSQRLEEFTI